MKLPDLNRRRFLQAATGVVTLPISSAVLGDEPKQAANRFPIIGFTKPFQSLPLRQLAETVATIGWQGIECPIRAKGQIEPARVADELPSIIEALKAVNCEVVLAATDITSISQPHAEKVLKALSEAGVRRVRLGFWYYQPDQSPADRLAEIGPAVRDLASACKELGLKAGIQNHSGAKYVGAPVWDIYTLIRDLDPASIGICFDIGHATLEGGHSWPIEAKLMEPFYTAVFVKDFLWAKGANGWKDEWCPLGRGMVNRQFFKRLKSSSYAGPICQHHEYELGDHDQMVAQMKTDLEVLRSWMS